jgi:molybdopterin molybdotransferase
MGKYDFVPAALDKLGVNRLFHKVKQRPGKPFWFGQHEASDTLLFAFPGNPVSAFLCTFRYFIPWLLQSQGIAQITPHAMLSEDFTFAPELQYFLQVNVQIDERGQLVAIPIGGNGSGDFSNLLVANAFMELPAEITNFRKGEAYRIWPFKALV